MKQYVMLFIVLVCSISIAGAQAQKQTRISYSAEKGWEEAGFTLQKTYTVEFNTPAKVLQDEAIDRMRKMEDDLVKVDFDEKTKQVTLSLSLEKRPDWTARHWYVYLQRRNAVSQ